MTYIMDILILRTAISCMVVLFTATPAKTKSLFKYCIKIQSQPMTVVKYNNCEFIGGISLKLALSQVNLLGNINDI